MRYGDFPSLFHGFPPDVEVDLWDTRTILRLMAFAQAEGAQGADPARADAEAWESAGRAGDPTASAPTS